MTGGKIIYLKKAGKLFSSVEFNGDMYPGGNADEILEKFEDGGFSDTIAFVTYVNRFNKRHYGYENELIQESDLDENVIDITNNWTDYLYIINESDEEWTIISKDNKESLLSKSLAIVNLQSVEEISCRAEKQMESANSKEITREANIMYILSPEYQAQKRAREREDYIAHEKHLDETLKRQEAELAELDAQLAKMDAQLAEKDAELAELDARLAERDAELAELDARLIELDAQLIDKME